MFQASESDSLIGEPGTGIAGIIAVCRLSYNVEWDFERRVSSFVFTAGHSSSRMLK